MGSRLGIVSIIAVILIAAMLFGCAQTAAPKNATNNTMPAANGSTGPTINNTPEETPQPIVQPSVPDETRRAAVKVSVSAVASGPIGKGLNSFNVTFGRIEIHNQGGWVTLSDNVTIANLVAASNIKQLAAMSTAPLGNYDRMRLNVISASLEYTTNTAIPGVVAERKSARLTIPSSLEEINMSMNESKENETYSATVLFDINRVDPATVSVFDVVPTVRVKTYSQCVPDCAAGCESSTVRYKECNISCAFDKSRDCDINATNKCIADCNCPNNVCSTGDQEQCKITCLSTEKSENSTCKLTINAACIDYCRGQPFFTSCTDSCMEEC